MSKPRPPSTRPSSAGGCESEVTGQPPSTNTIGEVSGTWVTGRQPASDPGLLLYVMVDDAEATVEAIVAHGGELVQPIGGDAPEMTARFRDPGGNVIGIYQEPGG